MNCQLGSTSCRDYVFSLIHDDFDNASSGSTPSTVHLSVPDSPTECSGAQSGFSDPTTWQRPLVDNYYKLSRRHFNTEVSQPGYVGKSHNFLRVYLSATNSAET